MVVILPILILSMSITSFADEIDVPFAINVEAFKHDCKLSGFDLYDGKKADGFVENKGSHFVIFTYKTIPVDKLDIITKATWKNIRK